MGDAASHVAPGRVPLGGNKPGNVIKGQNQTFLAPAGPDTKAAGFLGTGHIHLALGYPGQAGVPGYAH